MKTFWLNIGALDRDMDLSERKQILKALSAQNVEVRATFNYLKVAQEVQGVDKVWLFRLSNNSIIQKILLVIRQQILLLQNLDVDVVVLRAWKLHESLPVWWFWRRLLRKNKPKFVLDLRTVPVDLPNNRYGRFTMRRFKSSLRLALRYFDGVTVITEKLKIDIEESYDTCNKDITVWETGVDTDAFDPERVTDLRSRLGLNGRFVIIHHGIFSLNRGLIDVIKAIALLKDLHPEIMFLILGKGPAQEVLEKLVEDHGLENNVIIHPPVSFEDVPKYIKSADIGILPFPDIESWNTSSPIKLNEYLSMGRPVLVTDIAAHRTVLGEMPSGFFVPNNNPETLAKAIEQVLQVRDELPELGKVARKFALEKRTWEQQAIIIKKYFQEIL